MRIGRGVAPTPAEVAQPRPGDGLVAADVVMDRAFTVAAYPADVWPWLMQLGKGRAGWYLPRTVERFLLRRNRALRRLDARWTTLQVGDVVPDYGRGATLRVAEIDAPRTVVFESQRKTVRLTWTITLHAQGGGTRVLLRLRLGPVRRVWLARSVGEAFDLLTIAGMAAGLRERLAGAQVGT